MGTTQSLMQLHILNVWGLSDAGPDRSVDEGADERHAPAHVQVERVPPQAAAPADAAVWHPNARSDHPSTPARCAPGLCRSLLRFWSPLGLMMLFSLEADRHD